MIHRGRANGSGSTNSSGAASVAGECGPTARNRRWERKPASTSTGMHGLDRPGACWGPRDAGPRILTGGSPAPARGGEGSAGGELAPGFEIAEVGRKRAEGVVAHALTGKMLERRDLIVRQQDSKLVTAIEGQYGVERIEFFSAAGNGCR